MINQLFGLMRTLSLLFIHTLVCRLIHANDYVEDLNRKHAFFRLVIPSRFRYNEGLRYKFEYLPFSEKSFFKGISF